MKRTSLREHYADFRSNWETLTLYQRFEHAIALLLTWLIAVIVVATWGARPEVLALIAQRAIDPLGHRVFQAVFGEVMTLRIALEFRHSIIRVAAQQESIVQVKTVLLICVTRDCAARVLYTPLRRDKRPCPCNGAYVRISAASSLSLRTPVAIVRFATPASTKP